MIITYLRSSSVTAFEMCPMRFYIEYNLGWRQPSNKKAEKGTIVHKALEILGAIKIALQDGQPTIEDDICGEINVHKFDFDSITSQVYHHYSRRSPNPWDDEEDFKECKKWINKALAYRGGEFDPLKTNVVAVERSFDIQIQKPWAVYDYTMPDGSKIEGFFGIKGTIDQISKVDDETYLILDWKTGRRWDWAKDVEKTHDKLQTDHQLMMYYYAASQLFPEIEYIMVTIYFINDGGPFSIAFSRSDLPRIERMLQKKFEEIRDTEIPMRNRSWKCSKFCHYGMRSFKGTHVTPIKETRSGQVCLPGTTMTMCEQTNYCLHNRPESSVLKHMTAPGHTIDFYKAPGT